MINTLARPALPARNNRYPKHPFSLSVRPWAIQPMICAPVLPGETLTNLLLQSRVVTDPIKDKLIGWWLEYYFFYVKLTDLDGRDDFIAMITDPDTADVSSYREAAVSAQYFTAEGGISWSKLCLKRVVEEYFRDENTAWDAHLMPASTGLPMAAVGERTANWMQSLHMSDDLIALDVAVSTAGDDEFTMSELENARRQYELLKMHGLQKGTWEDYLRSEGVNAAQAVEAHKPELIRYVREWTYPTNTVNPANGTPTSACSWAITERADKARFFSEPGFIFGCQVVRPKVYYQGQVGSAAGFMQDAAKWLPQAMADDAWSSLTQHITTSDSGPVPGIVDAEGYGWDMRDLLLYGEQFTNYSMSGQTGWNLVALPGTTGNVEYVTETDVDNLFVSATVDKVRSDGVVHLTIKGRQRDTTPTPVQIG